MVEEFTLPKKGDHPFTAGDDPRTQVCLPFLAIINTSEELADAFKEAGDMVVGAIGKGEGWGHADRFLYPVAYLYRHYLEVAMKNLLRGGVQLNEITVEEDLLSRSHNLHKLWNKTKDLIVKMDIPKGDLAPLRAAEQVVLAFHNLDRDGQEFRYARTTDGEPTLLQAPDFICLRELADVMGRVYTLLSGSQMCVNAAPDLCEG